MKVHSTSTSTRIKSGCLLLVVFCYPLASIGQVREKTREGKVDSTGMITLRIDPQSARGASVSQVFDAVKFIPLETTKESLFGSISDLKIVKNQFLIFDYDTKAVLIFGMDGKFHAKIDASKIPKDDADKSKTNVWGFQTVAEGVDTLITITTNRYYCYFDLAGKLLKKVPHKDDHANRDHQFADKETSVKEGYLHKAGKDSTYYELAIIGKAKDTISYFPFSMKRYQDDDFWSSSKFFDSGTDNELLFINILNYNLYKIKPSGVSLAYRLIFPANNSLPNDFYTNPIYKKKRGEYFQKNGKVFYDISNSYLLGDHLYLQMHSYGYDKELKKSISYNLKTGEITSLQDLEPDSLSSFLPVTDAGAFYDFNNNGFNLYKEGYLYTSYSSLAMFTFREQLGTKHDTFTPAMQEYFKTQNRKSNPVIVQLKPKKD